MQQAPDTSQPAPRLRAQAQWVRRRRGPGEVRPRAWVGVAWALAPPLDLGHGRRRGCGSLSHRTRSGESGGTVAGARHYSHQLGSWREGRVLPVLRGMIFPRSVSSLRTEPLSRAASGTAIQEMLSSSSRRLLEHFWKRRSIWVVCFFLGFRLKYSCSFPCWYSMRVHEETEAQRS